MAAREVARNVLLEWDGAVKYVRAGFSSRSGLETNKIVNECVSYFSVRIHEVIDTSLITSLGKGHFIDYC